ncbi:MAG: exodeoxyribonuclease VII large subunit [Deltaproteobacteria bacterium]|nr:exodeoxyribonuclease VII large subunit [Deltaproteobacteria bacterium]
MLSGHRSVCRTVGHLPLHINTAGLRRAEFRLRRAAEVRYPRGVEQQDLVFSASAAPTPHIHTVVELMRLVKGQLDRTFADVWVVGEVSGFRPSNAGHCYFDLKDSDSAVHVALFRGVAQKVRFRIENGMELVCHGKLDLYTKRGDLTLVVDTLEPKGVGALQLAFEQLKAQLAKEGLFNPERKRRLPFFPRRVGIVTSPTGAAIRDMLHVLQRRAPGVDVVLAPARVQGDGAAAEVAAAIQLLDARGDCDVLIVGRGGGSMEDLWAFNEEVVARAIAACRTPLISAIGHEIDFTIADFVADVRAPTPSAAAEIVAPARADLVTQIVGLRQRLRVGLRRWWELRAQRIADVRRRLRPPTERFANYLLQIDHARERLAQQMRRGLELRLSQCAQLRSELEHLSPLAVLTRGYAVLTRVADGSVVTHVTALQRGESVRVRVAAGAFEAIVGEIYET